MTTNETDMRIHIDQHPHSSPNPTTGAALYALGKVHEGYELYKEVEGNREDRPIPNDNTSLELKQNEHFHSAKRREFKLIVNKHEHEWPLEFINGAEIKKLAGSPPDWVVNEVVPGPGGDPEIGDDQRVDLKRDASPHGIKRFTTRKPATSPGQ